MITARHGVTIDLYPADIYGNPCGPATVHTSFSGPCDLEWQGETLVVIASEWGAEHPSINARRMHWFPKKLVASVTLTNHPRGTE